jgi:hypothetical protein
VLALYSDEQEQLQQLLLRPKMTSKPPKAITVPLVGLFRGEPAANGGTLPAAVLTATALAGVTIGRICIIHHG